MRRHRVALKVCIAACAATLTGALLGALGNATAAPPTEATTAWTSSHPSPTIPSQPRTDLLTTANLAPLAAFYNAVQASEDNAAAAAYAQAEASVLASRAAASSSTPPASGQSAPSATSSTGACGAEDSIAPAAAARAEASGVPCAWVPTAVCEEQGYNGWGGPDGYFGIQAWYGFDGYPDATAAPLSVQLDWESAHGQGPPDAPGQCHGY